MKVIRSGLFETNSSSSHSLSISSSTKKDMYDSLLVEGDTTSIYPGEYGWGPDKLTSAYEKAGYCYTWARDYGTEEHKAMLEETIKQQTGAKKVHFLDTKEGYIDHQSDSVCAEAFLSHDTLKNLIFNKQSYIIIDNDNK